MDWWWVASCRNRGPRDLWFPKRKTPRPRLMRLRRRLDEKPTSERPPPCPTSAPCPYRTGTRAFPIRLSTIIRTGNAHDPIRLSTFIRIGADTLPVLVVNIHQGDRSNGQGFFFTLNLP